LMIDCRTISSRGRDRFAEIEGLRAFAADRLRNLRIAPDGKKGSESRGGREFRRYPSPFGRLSPVRRIAVQTVRQTIMPATALAACVVRKIPRGRAVPPGPEPHTSTEFCRLAFPGKRGPRALCAHETVGACRTTRVPVRDVRGRRHCPPAQGQAVQGVCPFRGVSTFNPTPSAKPHAPKAPKRYRFRYI